MDRQPVGDVLNGITIIPLETGSVAMECIILVKAMNSEGRASWSLRYSESVSDVEVIGALAVMKRHQEDVYESDWVPDEDGR